MVMRGKIARRFLFLLVVSVLFLFALSSVVFAVQFNGNVTLSAWDQKGLAFANHNDTFNFSNQTKAGGGGYIVFSNTTATRAFLEIGNGAKMVDLETFSGDNDRTDLYSELSIIPNKTFVGPLYDEVYRENSEMNVVPGDVIAVLMPDNTYAAVFVKEVNIGVNITFEYLFNNQTDNNTFYNQTGCQVHTNFESCFADRSERTCYWHVGVCRQELGYQDHAFAGCDMLPKNACDNIADGACLWNETFGTKGLCVPGPGFDFNVGFVCANITNETFCANQGFTEGTGLCTANNSNGSLCLTNLSKNFGHIPDPPVFSCSSSEAISNQSLCQNLSATYFMPCDWDNVTNQCENVFFDFDKFHDFGDINTEDTCKLMGGFWREETTFDPLNNKLSTEKWCEFGVAPPTFDSSGAGKFIGNEDSLRDCSKGCLGCEYNQTESPPVPWTTLAKAKSVCELSGAGCIFTEDSSAFNGHGHCLSEGGSGGFDCDAVCGDCNAKQNVQIACLNSSANCRWDNTTSLCVESGTKGCSQSCPGCVDVTSCQQSLASGGCTWVASTSICTPQGGSFEICFDGIDNDNNGQTDCSDFKCASDGFCGGGITDSNNCFQYDNYQYGVSAESHCTNATGCTWITDSFSFSYCAPLSEQCWQNASFFTDQTGCENFGGGDVCTFVNTGYCHENSTLVTNCAGFGNEDTCNNVSNTGSLGCKWKDFGTGSGFCDVATIVTCEENATLQSDSSLCASSGCVWQGSTFDNTFEGGHTQNCVSPCIASGLTVSTCTNATNATGFYNHTCVWNTGRCEPKDFVGGCINNDGDIAACNANDNCNWVQDPFGGMLRHPNGSTNFNHHIHTTESWFAIGLQRPTSVYANITHYALNDSSGNSVALLHTTANASLSSAGVSSNVSRVLCNNAVILEYNWTVRNCEIGQCNATNSTATCGGKNVHYFMNVTNATLELLWEVDVGDLDGIDAVGYNINLTDTANITTVVIDGVLNEHVAENAPWDVNVNATRVRTFPGFCDGGLQDHFFKGIDNSPPLVIAADTTGDGLSGHEYTDFSGLGVKKTLEAYMYGMPVSSMSGSVVCNGVPLGGPTSVTAFGAGRNTSKYYLYLDTDGTATGGCSPFDDSSLVGFEYLFKYIGELDTNGKLSETKLTLRCSGGSWVASNVALNSDKKKACGFIGGPVFAIDKDAFSGKSDVNTSKGWRAYGTSASLGGNSSNVTDVVGPGSADFRGIDAEIIDCTSTKFTDHAQCTKFKQFGFFPGEFGPACTDNKDNDGDGLTDCADFDCKFDPFFCSSSTHYVAFGTADPNDDSAPSFVSNKVNKKVPTSLTFIFGTNEPSNGSVRYYYNDTTCGTLNATYNDKAFETADTHDDYRPHHVVDIAGLTANKTYYYKFSSCDPSGNCAVSACNNATTALGHSNVTFKLEIPSGWSVDIPSINLSNYSKTYALKASTQHLNDMNMTINQTNSTFALRLIGIDLFEKQTINLSRFLTGADFLGIDANQYQNFKQKTGLEKAVVEIPSNGVDTILSHCDDAGSNCKAVTDKVTCIFNSIKTECDVPDAVGLGFSTYKTTTTTTTSSNNPGGGGGSSGGGGSGSAAGGAVSVSQKWNAVNAGDRLTMNVGDDDIAVSAVYIAVLNELTDFKVTISSYTVTPEGTSVFGGTAYQYIEIVKENADNADIRDAVIEFSVTDRWLDQKGVAADDVALYRNGDDWTKLDTAHTGKDGSLHRYEAITSGFSFFVIGVGETDETVAIDDVTGAAVDDIKEPVSVVDGETVSKSRGSVAVVLLIVAGLITAVVLFVFRRRRY
jgi:PGF-pre-PGF domain-containing protein